MVIEVKLKKWGNSMGLILPKELVREKKLKENQKISIQVVEKADLSDIFGSLKFKKSAQKLKDESREGWE